MNPIWNEKSVVEAVSPLRVDFAGMTDYIEAEGWCVNSSINLYAQMTIIAREDRIIKINAGTYGEKTFTIDEIDNVDDMFAKAIIKTGYNKLYQFGMDVTVDCEFGAIGLSSSSSVAAMYLKALGLICRLPEDPLKLAKDSQAIEPHWYGRQDQLAVSFGGINLWHMTEGKINNNRVSDFGIIEHWNGANDYKLDTLASKSFLLYHSGIEEGASGILNNVIDNYHKDTKLKDVFKEMNNHAQEIYKIIAGPNSDGWLEALGTAFDKIRIAHEKLHPSVTNKRMQDLFDAARNAGAYGERYSGAGGRGALTFICPPGTLGKINAALDKVDTPYVSEKTTYTKGHRIHFNGFSKFGAKAWFA